MLPEIKIIKNSAIHIQTFSIDGVSRVFLLHDLDLCFRFQMFKMCEIRSISYVAGNLKLWKKSAIHIPTFAIERRKYCFLLIDLDLHFQGKTF